MIDAIKNAASEFKEFIVENGNNPILWIVLFFAGILIFWTTYNSLHRD